MTAIGAKQTAGASIECALSKTNRTTFARLARHGHIAAPHARELARDHLSRPLCYCEDDGLALVGVLLLLIYHTRRQTRRH
jgi:hypothetical protein